MRVTIDATININTYQIEEGEEATSYVPFINECPITGWNKIDIYHSDEYSQSSEPALSINFNSNIRPIYDGEIVIDENGTVKVISKYDIMQNYNGQDLIGKWYSSLDLYSPNKKPTIGAQVCYQKSEYAEYELSDTVVFETLEGGNYIWCDTGETSVTYYAVRNTSRYSFGSPLGEYNPTNLQLFNETFIENGMGD